MHLQYPHHGSDGFKKHLSPPRLSATSINRVFFSIFYTVATTCPHIVVLVYWSILVPHEYNEGAFPPLPKKLMGLYSHTVLGDEFLGRGWLQVFVTVNAFGINSVIALIEILFLSSIRRQKVSRT